MKKRSLLISILLLVAAFLVACSEENSKSTANDSAASNKIKIYTTIFPLEDFTKKIGGDLVEVESILPPGGDAHTFEPTSKLMVDIAESDGFIYSGVGIENYATQIEEALAKEDVAFINAGKGIELESHDHETEETGEEAAHEHEDETHVEEAAHDEHDHGDTDPHVWLDPVLSITLAENIKQSLIDIHPEGKETFEENFQKLKSQLEDLDQSFKDLVKAADKKEILVSHAAYGYWQQRYGIEQISVLGLSPTEEPSQKELKDIIDVATEHDINHIIFEANVSSNVTDIVQSEIGAEALYLSNLETITEKDINNNEDYFSIMNKNLETLKKALSAK
ncbi:zinc ABC transporter substrate-binding protein [uncultured Metabacillus sp.]|uniref:metal ABC transporter solute-binding protein, Zn/Mn family n=1 Tax=uncultured Metabacillus sp. TaxID=2860135 RepID=UPI00262A2A81|nr:zinc ABC transporter substrate-binding protein [uncultured Metabacillus sp.]